MRRCAACAPEARRKAEPAAEQRRAEHVESFKEFPPRAKAASFSVDETVESPMPKG